MQKNAQLYKELYQLRERFKNQGRRHQGRAPIVCTDEALDCIVEMHPKHLKDFLSVPGIGQSFVDLYGQDFLSVILKYTETSTEKAVNLNDKTIHTIKELEKKLVSINRKNRLLYMPKCASKYGVDLFDENTSTIPSEAIFTSKTITICNLLNPSSGDYENEEKLYRKLVYLLREINKDAREHGSNDLYIGWPYVIGRISGENFDIRTPLALFPIVAERTVSEIKIKLDSSRDILYNNTFILAYNKFNSINAPLPQDVIENITKETFIHTLLEHYAENDIKIAETNTAPIKFKEYKAGEFPQYRSGDLFLEPCMVLGKFSVSGSAIQRDFDEILKSNTINVLLNDLLQNIDDIDYYSDAYAGDTESVDNDKKLAVSETNLVYFNELNSSQESVLNAIDKVDELVVQGPPGTGKSQTITSLIADFVSKGKTVLMVSEKKTALDVVYSRLGSLSKYALLIDDVGNKEDFYRQMFNMTQSACSSSGDLKADAQIISLDIDNRVSTLEKIAKVLYEPDEYGIEPYKLYILSKKIDFSNPNEKAIAKAIYNNTVPSIMELTYKELDNLHKYFDNPTSNKRLEEYLSIIGEYEWLSKLKPNLTEYEIVSFQDKLEKLGDEIADWQKKFFLVRLFTKHRIIKQVKNTAVDYFSRCDRSAVKLVFKKTDVVSKGIAHYSDYLETKPLYTRLDDTQKDYLSSMCKSKEPCQNSLEIANDKLFNSLIVRHIENFERKNAELFHEIDNFENIISELTRLIITKKEITRKALEDILANEMYGLVNSKHSSEIKRQIENRRKWSVSKFISKFSFELFNSVRIWLLTPEVVSEIIPLQTGTFDLVVFDEASQMYVEKGVPAILRAKKVVVAGDHKQLRPSNLGAGRVDLNEEENGEEIDDSNAALEEESLLDLARFKYDDVLLNFHYRSKYEELIAFSNYAFYQGRLYVTPNTVEPEISPIKTIKIDDGLWINRYNYPEAKKVVELLKYIFQTRKNNETIGIITFNITQRDLIDDLIDEECAKDPDFSTRIKIELTRSENGEDIGLFVKNIESVQGDERDIIIFSIGYAQNENGRIIRNFGWLNQEGGENRLNVAISRAKEQVYIITSIYPEELQVEDTKNDGPKYLKKYLEYAFAVSNKDKLLAKQILNSFGDATDNGKIVSFDSDFENQVYDALIAKGYDVDTQVGIGGYSIDLAIKSNGHYILGIECDGKLYHSSKSARERDYHRQKYLESRGWKIHRIWSPNWWKNPKTEIAKIENIVKAISSN